MKLALRNRNALIPFNLFYVLCFIVEAPSLARALLSIVLLFTVGFLVVLVNSTYMLDLTGSQLSSSVLRVNDK